MEFLRSMEDAPRGDVEDIIIFKDVASVIVCHIARWEDGTDGFEKGWWAFTRGSVTQEKIDEIGELIGWIPQPYGYHED